MLTLTLLQKLSLIWRVKEVEFWCFLSLDEIEKYCQWRGFHYMRLDGSTSRVIRELDIRDFNAEESDKFVYLISTRAGGVGINLHASNHVVLFDSDFNPHADNQAIDRSHRIGQTRKVYVYRLAHEWTVEEKLLFRQQVKLALEAALVGNQKELKEADVEEQEASTTDSLFTKLSSHEIEKLIGYGSNVLASFSGEDITSCSIHDLCNREHKDLPEIAEPEESDEEEESSEEVNATEEEQSEKEVEDQSVMLDKRTRIATKFFAADLLSDKMQKKSAPRRRLFHEQDCFMCKDGGDVIECDICPRVYHADCQNLDEPPKGRWTCSWHECWDCFRKSSQVGGNLIHCVNCPKAFCLDCFPTSFRRMVPPEAYWKHLNRLGWEVDGQKMITFICNDCRVFLDQEKRQLMKKREIEAANRQKITESKQVRTTAAESLAVKLKAIKELGAAYVKAQESVREAFENCVPELLEQKCREERLIPTAESLKEISNKDMVTMAINSGISIVSPLAREDLIQKLTSGHFTGQYPKLMVSLCGNCQLPGHGIMICPYPPESVFIERSKGSRMMGCPICSSNTHTRITCDRMPYSVFEEYKSRILSLKNVASVVNQRAPVPLSEPEKLLNANILRQVVSGKIERIVEELNHALQHAISQKHEFMQAKKSDKSNLAFSTLIPLKLDARAGKNSSLAFFGFDGDYYVDQEILDSVNFETARLRTPRINHGIADRARSFSNLFKIEVTVE
jgi:adenosinetriphosphatase